LSNLLKPLKAGSLSLTNRLVMPPMATSNCPDGIVTQEILDYYTEKSQGGYISLIIIEHSYITPEGRAGRGQISIGDNSNQNKLKELAAIIQNNGSKAVMQISHAGLQSDEEITGFPPVGPSSILNPKTNKVALELTALEIQNIIKAFGAAAKRVKDAGFDGVEIHSAHGYLLNQFFSPLTNKRSDAYGGDIINRIKIHLEVIEEVRNAVGEDFPILLRLGASDYTKGGSTIEDSLVAAKEFEKAGIDILDISGGFCGYKNPDSTEEGYFSHLTEAIKNVVSIPVLLTGGIINTKAAEELLSSGKADLIGVGRAIFTNSNWAKNAIESLN